MSGFWTLFWAVVILAAGATIGTWLQGLTRTWLDRSGMDPQVRRLLTRMVRPLVLILAFIAALDWLAVETTQLAAVLGAATLAVGMALKESLSNVASGAILLTLRPYREGDFVECGGRQGTVDNVNVYITTLITGDGTLISLPNDLVLHAPIVNFTRHGTRRAELSWTLSHDADVAKAIKTLQAALDKADGVLETPATTVRVVEAGPGGVVLQARAWVDTPELADRRSALIAAGLAALTKAGVPLARWTPHQGA